MTAREISAADWPRLSPLLDDLLGLTSGAQAARLAALRSQDAPLADGLQALLGRLPGLGDDGFLASPALPAPDTLATPAGPAHQAGQSVGAYTLLRALGQGGMGSVWLAQRADGRYDAQVAIKFMHGGLFARGDAERFLREGQLLARLDHPHIARLLDAGLTGPARQPYLVLERVDGVAIDRHCDAQQLDLRARVRLMLQVLAAVAHAHSRLVLHRDLKPSNILVTPEGSPKLLDFGIGKLLGDNAETAEDVATHTRATPEDLTGRAGLAFTARYAAPEQLQGQEVTTATDVYALGVLLYGLLGGGHPTEGTSTTPLAQWQAVTDTVPRRLSDAVLRSQPPGGKAQARLLRGDLDTIVARALKKHPAERYANAAALADDLRRWLDHEPITARPDTAGYRIGRFLQRHRRIVIAAGTVGAVALTAGAGLALWQAREARAQRAQAEWLVQFMLGDLSTKLTEVGRVDLLQTVGEKTLAYYDSETVNAGDPGALALRAKAQRVIGDAARHQLNRVQAQRAFDAAARTTAHLLALAPNDLARIDEHVISLEKVEEMAEVRGDNAQALALHRELSALRHRAAAGAPGDPDLQGKAIAQDRNVAYSLTRAWQPAAALHLLDTADAALAKLPATLPDMALAWADTHLTRGLALTVLGRYQAAVLAFDNCARLMGGLPDLHTNILRRFDRAIARQALAGAQLQRGDTAAAVATLRQALADGVSESAQDAHNYNVIGLEVTSRRMLADALWRSGQRQAARDQLHSAWELTEQVQGIDADDVEWHLKTRGALLALRLRLLPRTAADLPAMQAVLAKVTAREAAGHTLQGTILQTALELGLLLGDALDQAGQPAAARAQWLALVQRAQPAAVVGFPPAMSLLAQAQVRLGDTTGARHWLNTLQAGEYRHPDIADLARRLVATQAR